MDGRVRTQRFTVAELVISLVLMVVVLGGILPFLATVQRHYTETDLANQMRMEALLAIERLTRDLQSTASDMILATPQDGSALQAITAPLLKRDPEASTSPVNADGEIDWTHTVVYHLYTAGDKTQLRRTVFTDRNNALSVAERRTQLESVLSAGNGGGAANGINASTRILLRDLKQATISMDETTLDTYAPAYESRPVFLGSQVLTAGEHVFRFVVQGHNVSSSGRALGVDSLTSSQSGSALEAEHLPLVSIGATASVRDMSGYSDWNNQQDVLLPATSDGAEAVYTVYNDTWMEAEFANDEATLERTCVRENDTAGDIVLEMNGNATTWMAASQAPENIIELGADLSGFSFRTLIAGADALLGGNILYEGQQGRVRFAGPLTNGRLTLDSAYIMERSSGMDGVAGTIRQLTFSDAAGETGVTVFNSGKSVTLAAGAAASSDLFDLKLDPAKDYLVSYHISATSGSGYSQLYLGDFGDVQSYYVQNDLADSSGVASWSSLPAGTAVAGSFIYAVESVFGTYPADASYVSAPFDTHLAAPAFLDMQAVTSNVAVDIGVRLRVRTGAQPDMSDAPDWSAASEFAASDSGVDISAVSSKRYVQFQAVFTSKAPYDQTARLHMVAIRWPGQTKGVGLAGRLTYGPDCGKVKLFVDDEPTPVTGILLNFVSQRSFLSRNFEHAFSVQCDPHNR